MKLTQEEKENLYRDYHSKILRYIIGKVTDPYLGEDICSDVFLKVYEKLDTFEDSKSSLSTWIYTITRNTLIDYYRTRKIVAEVPEEFEDDNLVEDNILKEEMLDTLAEALESLEDRERKIIVLRYYSGMSLKEIGDELNISYAYVKILHKKSLETLKKFFD